VDRRHPYRPSLEWLEDRWNPSGTVTGSFANGTWTLIGDAEANEIRINPAGVLDQFTVTGLDGTTVAGVTNPSNVKNIVVRLRGGDDYVEVNNTNALSRLLGDLRIFGGSGANFVEIDYFKMKNLTIIHGDNTTNSDELYLTDSIVRQNVTINNGDGDSYNNIYRSSSDISEIGGDVTIINGVGEDSNYFNDTHIGGNVKVLNGRPDSDGDAGYFEVYNTLNETSRSIIGGNVFVRYQGGDVDYDGIWDTEVLGNVTFRYDGDGEQTLYFDGYSVTQPVHIHGDLTVIGQGNVLVDIGRQYEETGLIVGGNFTVQTGDGSDTVNIDHMSVGGTTLISTYASNDVIRIDNSSFVGPTTILTRAGNDTLLIESSSGSAFGTQFAGALTTRMGDGDDTQTFGFGGDATRLVEVLAGATLSGGDGNDTLNDLNLVSVFGKPIGTDLVSVKL
jgi:hypothetical protein